MRRNKLIIKTGVKAGGFGAQHNVGALKIRSGVRAGGFGAQHNRAALAV